MMIYHIIMILLYYTIIIFYNELSYYYDIIILHDCHFVYELSPQIKEGGVEAPQHWQAPA